MFNLFVYLLSSALETHVSFRNVFLKKKSPNVFKETWLDQECKNLLRERQLDYEKYTKISSPENWSAYSKLRSKLSSVVNEKQERVSWNCFISVKSSKDRWMFINNVRGQNQSINTATLKHSFADLIVDDKKIAEHFNVIFSNLVQYFGREYEDSLIYKAGDESFSFCPITEKYCYDFLK